MLAQTSSSVHDCKRAMCNPFPRSPICAPLDFKTTSRESRDMKANRNTLSNNTPSATTLEMDSSAHEVVRDIRGIYTALNGLSSLKPGPQVNTLLIRLVEICIASHSEAFASQILSLQGVDDLCATLRPLCATAEGELEKYWTLRILETSKKKLGKRTTFFTDQSNIRNSDTSPKPIKYIRPTTPRLLPIPPELSRSQPSRMLNVGGFSPQLLDNLPPIALQDCVHRLGTSPAHLILRARTIPGSYCAQCGSRCRRHSDKQ